MILRIEDIVLNSFSSKKFANELRYFDSDSTYENWLSFFMSFDNFFDYSLVFFFLSLVNSIVMIDTLYRSICRNSNYVHSVDISKFLLFCKSCTCHTSDLVIFIEKVLESDICQSHTLAFNFYFFLCLDSLM